MSVMLELFQQGHSTKGG